MKKTSNSIVYLGVDIGKSEHAWTLIDASGSLLEEGTVLNKADRLVKFAKRISKDHPVLLMGCEATGSYYENIAIAFNKLGVVVRVINPALTSTKALRSSMRMTKTDKQDARGIARKLQEKKGDIGTVFSWNPEERRLQAMA
ncbi:transposase, partial [Patescibacteria group bacterium]